MKSIVSVTVGFLALLPSLACAQANRPWSQGDPSAQEQAALQWLNAARRDPVGTLSSLLGASDPVIAGFLRAEAPVPSAQLVSQLSAACQIAQSNSGQFPNSSAISQAPLVFYPLFQQQAALRGAQASAPVTNFPAQRPPPDYIYPVPSFGGMLLNGPDNVLTGPNATGGTAQFGPYGANYTEVSQANLYASYVTGREWVLTMLAAPGSGSPPPAFLAQGEPIPERLLGHTRMTGLALTPGKDGAQVLTLYKGSQEFFTQSDLPFGSTNTVFVTGVAFRDSNTSGFYDAGEGLGGVKITLDRGDWYAVTATAGGYAIPVPANSGTYTLTATGGPFSGATATVTVGSDNVQCDWVLPASARPPQVPVAASDGANQLLGLSTRGLIQTGANVLIGGFVIDGPPGVQKQVLIRGVGPSLQTAGFPADECIPATQIQVYDRAGNVIAANNGWTTAADGGAAVIQAGTLVGEFPLYNWPGGGGDSALVTMLAPGGYTVIVSPAPGLAEGYRTGRVGLVEIYDVSKTDGSRFVNISTRALVGTGDAQLIVGWTVGGSGHKRLLVRGIGPTLGAFDLSGVLANPTLTLYDATSHPLDANDDWSESAQADQIRTLANASGAFSLSEASVDASILTLSAPGNYSAVVGAKSGAGQTGIALVELYETP